jgi:hypothetical protein
MRYEGKKKRKEGDETQFTTRIGGKTSLVDVQVGAVKMIYVAAVEAL